MGWQQELRRASQRFRDGERHVTRAEQLMARRAAGIPSADAGAARQAGLAADLSRAAEALAPGFLGVQLSELPDDTPPRHNPPPGVVHVRVGTARPVADAGFPALVPLLGQGHLVIDGDASDPRVAGLLQSVLLRVLASVPRLEVSLVDCVALGQTFTGCAPLVSAGLAAPTATDTAGLAEALDAAEAHVRQAQQARHDGAGEVPFHLVVIGGLPPGLSQSATGRIAALAHAGPHGRTHLVLAGWSPRRTHEELPAVDNATYVTVDGADGAHRVGGIGCAVDFDPPPPPLLTRGVYEALGERHRADRVVGMPALIPQRLWEESSLHGLSTTVGRDSRGEVRLSFDDVTPHWLIGGRTGGGKTVFLLDLLYGLAARYGPRELAMYLLDFKEGVSFTEFTPSAHDATWIPHVRAVGVESDREYGVAVLAELRTELNRRAGAMKRVGVTKLADLRAARPDQDFPRVLAVIDEFHVLFAGNDRLARTAVAHLEELARKGRSYGIHLVLASQTISGIEALYAKTDSIFGQFPMRVALPGAKRILHHLNEAAESITIGQAIVNPSGGTEGFNRQIHFPDATAEPELLSGLRRELWQRRDADAPRPAVFAGYAEQHLESSPDFARLAPGGRRPRALVGRAVDVGISTVACDLDAVPGRHLAVLGTSAVGADVLHAATLSLARQFDPGRAEFVLAALVAQADGVVDATAEALAAAGHRHAVVATRDLAARVEELSERDSPDVPTYLVVFGGDNCGPVLGTTGISRLRTLLKQGPGRGVHVLGWWRGARRFIEDIGGTASREDVACLMLLNVRGKDVGSFIGDINSEYEPRANRALLIDRHDNTTRLCVPFVREGREIEELAA